MRRVDYYAASPYFSSMSQTLVIALYKFVDLPDFKELRQPLIDFCNAQKIQGSILLASEGINGTIAGAPKNIEAVVGFLRADPRLANLEYKESHCDKNPFRRMKVLLKKEIVTLGEREVDPNSKVGAYVDPKEWNKLISDPDVILIDTRNEYEVELGTFKGAKNPHTKSFRQFPEYVRASLDPLRDTKIALFCTGGIRCEKASSYMLNHGFKEVYHLAGGILKYLENVPAQESLWQGECFVFDGRVSVIDQLKQGSHKLCFSCQHPVSPQEMESELYKEGISCPRCHDTLTPMQRAGREERQRQIDLARARNEQNIGTSPRTNRLPDAASNHSR